MNDVEQKLREALQAMLSYTADLNPCQGMDNDDHPAVQQAATALSLPTQAATVEGGVVDQARFDAGCDVLKYLRQEGAPPRITNLMLVCLHGDPERPAPPTSQEQAAPVEGREVVGEVVTMPGASRFTMACFHADKVPVGTKLYTTPTRQPGA